MRGRHVASVAAMCASACVLSDSDEQARLAQEPSVQWIAIGAEVELRLTECNPGGDGRLYHCLRTRIAELGKLEVDDNFELVSTRSADGEVYALLLAKSEGKAILRIEYQDEKGKRHDSKVRLHAAKPGSIGVSADCGDGPMLKRELYLGAGSSFDVTLDPRTEGRQILETGELELFDFGAFEVLEQEGTRIRLRAPLQPGPDTWVSVAKERFEVSVYDGTSVGLIPVAAQGGASILRLVSDPGGPACTSAPGALAELRVKQGDCGLGISGVRVSGALPLLVESSGTQFEVTGQGECTLSVLVDGATVAEHTLRVDSARPATAPGLEVGTTPLRFDLHDPLPTASCDKGITDGDCEPLIGLIPDADCFTDADFRIEHFDSRGPIEDGDYVGTGLVTSVALGVVVGPDLLEGKRAPMDVTWSYDEQLLGLLASEEDVDVEIGACMAPAGETRIVQIEVDAVGPHQIEFEASNINDTAELDFAARDVDRGRIQVGIDDTIVAESEWPLFAGSSVTLSAHYERSDGLVLRGDAPIEVVSNVAESGARIAPKGMLFVGHAPSTLQVTPSVGSGGQRLLVVAEESVAELRWTMRPAALQVGQGICVDVAAYDVNSQIIRGAGTVPLTAQLDVAELAWVFDPSTTTRSVCLRAVGSAAGTLTLSMGEAAAEVTLPIASE